MQVYGVGPWFNSGEEIPLVAAVDRVVVVVVVAVVLALSPIGGGGRIRGLRLMMLIKVCIIQKINSKISLKKSFKEKLVKYFPTKKFRNTFSFTSTCLFCSALPSHDGMRSLNLRDV